MRTETYYCDRCKCTITDIVYQLSCTATAINCSSFELAQEASAQSIRQSLARQICEKHLCRDCKNTLTDGLFVV